MNSTPSFCDVSLPVPLDQAFTYLLPETLRHRVQTGSRVLVPFGARQLIGVVLKVHQLPPPTGKTRQVHRLIDETPVLEEHLIRLGAWIAQYYCAPLGEVLRGMAPLSGEVRRTEVYSITDSGRDLARQMSIDPKLAEDPSVALLHLLERRSLSAATLKKKFEDAPRRLQALVKKGLIELEQDTTERDPLRASSERLEIEFAARPGGKLPKAERELIAYLELHPGPHNLGALDAGMKHASTAGRALARKSLAKLTLINAARPLRQLERAVPVLNGAQQFAFDTIAAALSKGEFAAYLLQGVTGSGKTEVYLRAIEATLALGRSALLLVPEIGLTPQVAGQFSSRFGDRVAILHSAFTEGERAQQWRRIRQGEAQVVVGTRSGVFAPVPKLGLVLIDEEHDSSYKQEETPRYNGRDVAVVRAQMEKAVVVLGSATPSLETKYNVERSKYQWLQLPERIEKRPMPDVEVVDMRVEFLETKKSATFSRRLVELIDQRVSDGEQVMLLLNRRGFSTSVACRSCGERLTCVNCAVALTFHRRDRRMLCHYCSHAERVPDKCAKCGSEHIYFLGTGAEKVEDELHGLFPRARIARMDRDTVTTKRHYESILQGFREKSFDILVGTQMIAKGHDIPNVTLVGIVSGDIGLGLPDFRAAERTFQLLTQAAGRAGRGDLPGQVIIQTINPDHYAIECAAAQDYARFYAKEIEFRRFMRYPPFAALANVVLRHEKQEEALRMSGEVANLLEPPPANMRILGPAEAPVARLRNEFRYQLLLKTSSRKLLAEVLLRIRQHALAHKWGATALVIDVDPLTLS
jgi:primosomal protein N' (replication factor Y)